MLTTDGGNLTQMRRNETKQNATERSGAVVWGFVGLLVVLVTRGREQRGKCAVSESLYCYERRTDGWMNG